MLNYEEISKKAIKNKEKTIEVIEMSKNLKELKISLEQEKRELEDEVFSKFSGIPEDFEMLLSNNLNLPISSKLNSKLNEKYSFQILENEKKQKSVIFEISNDENINSLIILDDFLLKLIPDFDIEYFAMFNYKKSFLSLGVEVQKFFHIEMGRLDIGVCYNKEKGFMLLSFNVVGDIEKKCEKWLPDLASLQEEIRSILNYKNVNYNSIEKNV